MTSAPLVLVTRPSGPADPLVAVLRARRYRVAAVPTVEIRPIAPDGPLDRALTDPDGWAWIVVTSALGAAIVGETLARSQGRVTPRQSPRWAAVGPATADALERSGIRVDLVPHESSGVGIARELTTRSDLRGLRVLLTRADAASRDLPTALAAAGAEVHDVVAYHTVEAPGGSAGAVAEALADGDLAAIVVASGSAVRGLFQLASDAGMRQRMLETPIVSIGPRTSAVARDLGVATVVEADQPSTKALAAAIDLALCSPSITPARRLP